MTHRPVRSTARRRAATLAVAAVALAAPTAAQAGTVTSDGVTATYASSAPGAADFVTVAAGGLGVTFTGVDPGGASGSCSFDDATGIASCPLGPGGVVVATGDGDDRVGVLTLSSGALPDGALRVDLGPGADEFRGDTPAEIVMGGPGADTIDGWGGDDVIDGGAGDDALTGERGRDTLRGGEGNDTLRGDPYSDPAADIIDGGPGVDRLDDYTPTSGEAASAPAITVTLDGVADDGKPGEGDNVIGIERLSLGSAGTIVGDDGANEILPPEAGARSTIDARGGADRVVAGDANGDRVDGGAGDDELAGGFGDDVLIGGPGRDVVAGDRPARCNELHCDFGPGFGNDLIEVRDGEVDSVSCGPGQDRVVADPADVVAADCEVVDRAAVAPGGPAAAGLRLTSARLSLRPALTRRGAVLRLRVPGPGRVSVAVRAGRRVVASGTVRTRRAGLVPVRVRARAAARSALRGRATLRVTAVVRFVPRSGPARTVRANLRLTR